MCRADMLCVACVYVLGPLPHSMSLFAYCRASTYLLLLYTLQSGYVFTTQMKYMLKYLAEMMWPGCTVECAAFGARHFAIRRNSLNAVLLGAQQPALKAQMRAADTQLYVDETMIHHQPRSITWVVLQTQFNAFTVRSYRHHAITSLPVVATAIAMRAGSIYGPQTCYPTFSSPSRAVVQSKSSS
jgi:hypothetical protein